MPDTFSQLPSIQRNLEGSLYNSNEPFAIQRTGQRQSQDVSQSVPNSGSYAQFGEMIRSLLQQYQRYGRAQESAGLEEQTRRSLAPLPGDLSGAQLSPSQILSFRKGESTAVEPTIGGARKLVSEAGEQIKTIKDFLEDTQKREQEERDKALKFINDQYETFGSGVFTGEDSQYIAELEKKAGLQKGYIERRGKIKTLREVQQESLNQQRDVKNQLAEQRLTIAAQNAQNSTERAQILNELNNIKLQTLLAGGYRDSSGNPITLPEKGKEGLLKIQGVQDTADNITAKIQEIGPTIFGPKARLRGVLQKSKEFIGLAPKVRDYESFRQASIAPLARAISGEVGVLTDRDIARAEGLLPKIGESQEEVNLKLRNLYKAIEDRRGAILRQYGVGDILQSTKEQAPKSGQTKGGMKYKILPK